MMLLVRLFRFVHHKRSIPFGLTLIGLTPIGLGLPPFGQSINGGSPNDVSPNGGSLRVSPNGVNPCYLIRQRRLNYIHIY